MDIPSTPTSSPTNISEPFTDSIVPLKTPSLDEVPAITTVPAKTLLGRISQFRIQEVAAEDYGLIQVIGKDWEKMADKKTRESLEDPRVTPEEGEMLDNCVACCSLIQRKTPERKGVVSIDDRGVVQAIAAYFEPTLERPEYHLDVVVTHPNNIEHPANEHIEKKVRGAGTAIIAHLATKVSLTKIPIRIAAFPEIVSYYEKLSFEHMDMTGKPDWSLPKMELTATGVQSFFKKKRS